MESKPPVGWKHVELRNIAGERKEKIIPQPDDDRPYIALEHIAQGTPALLGIGRAEDASSAKTVFRKGDILFGKLRPNLRKCVRVNFSGVCSTDIIAIYPRDGVCADYLVNLLHSEKVMQYADRTSIGTKMPRTSWEQLALCSVTMPPLPEQTRIATILLSLDNAIDQTRSVIDQTRHLKMALLGSLLTRGLPGKRTKFRKIRLGEAFQERKERGRPGLPIMAVTMNDGLVERTSLDRRMDTSLDAESHLLARKGDIGYNMMRMWQGVFGLAQRDCLISPAYVVVTPLAGIVPEYAAYLFKHPAVIRKFHLFSQGLTDDRLRLYFDQFKTITLQIVADEASQRTIAATLQAVDDRIESLITYSERLSCVKQALSHVLLTGKLRVKPARNPASPNRTVQPSAGGRKWRKK